MVDMVDMVDHQPYGMVRTTPKRECLLKIFPIALRVNTVLVSM